MSAILHSPDPKNFWHRWNETLPGGNTITYAQPRRIVDKFPSMEPEPPTDPEPEPRPREFGVYPVPDAIYNHLRESAWAAWFPPDASAMRRALCWCDGCCPVCGIRLARPLENDKLFINLLVFSWWQYDRVPLCLKCHTLKGAADPLEWLTRLYPVKARAVNARIEDFLRESKNW